MLFYLFSHRVWFVYNFIFPLKSWLKDLIKLSSNVSKVPGYVHLEISDSLHQGCVATVSGFICWYFKKSYDIRKAVSTHYVSIIIFAIIYFGFVSWTFFKKYSASIFPGKYFAGCICLLDHIGIAFKVLNIQ